MHIPCKYDSKKTPLSRFYWVKLPFYSLGTFRNFHHKIFHILGNSFQVSLRIVEKVSPYCLKEIIETVNQNHFSRICIKGMQQTFSLLHWRSILFWDLLQFTTCGQSPGGLAILAWILSRRRKVIRYLLLLRINHYVLNYKKDTLLRCTYFMW